MWSFVHHTSLYVAAVFSIAVSVITQWADEARFDCALPYLGISAKNLLTLLTFVAGSLTALAAAGEFQKKWLSNRISRSKLDQLLLDLNASDISVDEAWEHFKRIMRSHDEAILEAEE